MKDADQTQDRTWFDICMSRVDNRTMRTTIRMPESLRRQLMQLARREGRTFTEMIHEAAMLLITQRASGAPRKRRKRIVFPVVGDPKRKMSEQEYRAMIDRMYEQEAQRIIRGNH